MLLFYEFTSGIYVELQRWQWTLTPVALEGVIFTVFGGVMHTAQRVWTHPPMNEVATLAFQAV